MRRVVRSSLFGWALLPSVSASARLSVGPSAASVAQRSASSWYASRMEHLPANKIVVRRWEAESGEAFASLTFKYKVRGSVAAAAVSVQRPLAEPWPATLARLHAKLTPSKKKMKRRRKDEDDDPLQGLPYDGPPISFLSEEEREKGLEDESLHAVLARATGLRVGDVSLSFQEETREISKAALKLIPMVGFPVVARVAVNPAEAAQQLSGAWYRDELTIRAAKPRFVIDTATRDQGHPAIPNSSDEGVLRMLEEGRLSVGGWERVGEGRVYVPREEDLKRRLGFVADLGPDSIAKATEPLEVRAGPGEELAWESRQSEHTPDFLTQPHHLRLVCYNVLADLYMNLVGAQEDLWFPYCPKEFLKASYRYPLLLRELPGYRADLLLLQEVDSALWECYLEAGMRSAGYSGVFSRKGGSVAEGAALLLRDARLRLVSRHDVLLADLMAQEPDVEAYLAQAEWHALEFTSRPTILQASLVEEVGSEGPLLLVGNTHLHSLPTADHIRAVQLALCLRHLQRLQRHLRQERGREVRLMLCGDLNNERESPALRFLDTGRLGEEDPVWQRPPNALTPGLQLSGIKLSHDLSLQSLSESMAFTIHCQLHGRPFKAAIDHVYAEKEGVELVGCAAAPSEELLTRHTAIPSKTAPSDHLPIIIHFRLS